MSEKELDKLKDTPNANFYEEWMDDCNVRPRCKGKTKQLSAQTRAFIDLLDIYASLSERFGIEKVPEFARKEIRVFEGAE